MRETESESETEWRGGRVNRRHRLEWSAKMRIGLIAVSH